MVISEDNFQENLNTLSAKIVRTEKQKEEWIDDNYTLICRIDLDENKLKEEIDKLISLKIENKKK